MRAYFLGAIAASLVAAQPYASASELNDLLAEQGQFKHYICQRTFGSAFALCGQSPWACPPLQPLKAPEWEWQKAHRQEIFDQRLKFADSDEFRDRLRVTVVNALLEETRGTSTPITDFAKKCGFIPESEPRVAP